MADKRTLPRWQNKWSDGCTASPNRGWWGSHVEACYRHDAAYYYGGSRKHRQEADRTFRRELIELGMPTIIALVYCTGVHLLGTPYFKFRRASWAFGDEFYRYSDEPAEPVDVDDGGKAAGWRHYKGKHT